MSTKKIVILDDQKITRKAIKQNIARDVAQDETNILLCSTLDEAMGKLKEKNVDFFITDIKLTNPSASVLDKLGEIKTEFSGTKIIVVTGGNTNEIEAKEKGADYFLKKPIDWEILNQILFPLNGSQEDDNDFATLRDQLNKGNDNNFILQILDGAMVGINITDLKRRVIYFNKKQQEISKEIKLKEPCFKSCTPYSSGFCEECLSVRSKPLKGFTTHFRNGCYYDVYNIPIKDVNDRTIANAKVSKEVTDRERLTDLQKQRQGTMPLHTRIDIILEFILKMGFSRVRLFMASEDGKYLTGYAVQGQKDKKFVGQTELIDSDEFTAKSFQEKKLQVHKTSTYKGPWSDNEYLREWVDIPLLKDGVPVALITIDNYDENYPDMVLDKIRPISKETVKEATNISGGIIDAIHSDLVIRKQQIEKMLSDANKEILDKTTTDEIYACILKHFLEILEYYWGHVYWRDDKNREIPGQAMKIEGIRLNRAACVGSLCATLPPSFNLLEDKNIPEVCAVGSSDGTNVDDISENSISDAFTKHADSDNSSKYKKAFEENCIQSFACLPIKLRDKTIGVISVYSQRRSLINDYIKDMFHSFIQSCAPVLSRMYASDEAHQHYTRMKGLAEVIDHLLRVGDDRNKLIWIMLTGLTHHDGLAYNRAIFFDYIQDKGYKARFAVGPVDIDQASSIYAGARQTPLNVAIEQAEKANEVLTRKVEGALQPCDFFSEEPKINKHDGITLNGVPIGGNSISFSLLYNNDCYGGLLLNNFYTGVNPNVEDMDILKIARNIFTLFLHNLKANEQMNDLLLMIFHRLKTDIAGPFDSIKLAEDNNDVSYINQPLMKETLWELLTNTNDLLSFSRYKIEKTKPLITEINAHKIVSKVIKHFSTHRQFLNNIPQDVSVFAEERSIEHAFVNLIDNAVKYSPDGSSVVIVHQSDEKHICFTVRNEVEQPFDFSNPLELFERFKKGANSKGEGLGLYIVKGIAKQHGGEVFCEIKGNSASFSFSILRK